MVLLAKPYLSVSPASQETCLTLTFFYYQASSGKWEIIFKGQQVRRILVLVCVGCVYVCVCECVCCLCLPMCVFTSVYIRVCVPLCVHTCVHMFFCSCELSTELTDKSWSLACRHNDGYLQCLTVCSVYYNESKSINGLFWIRGQEEFTVNSIKTKSCKTQISKFAKGWTGTKKKFQKRPTTRHLSWMEVWSVWEIQLRKLLSDQNTIY